MIPETTTLSPTQSQTNLKTILITIVGATSLSLSTYRKLQPSAYVKLEAGHLKFKTGVCASNTNPEWDCPCPQLEIRPEAVIILSVFDKRFVGPDRYVGRVMSTIAKLLLLQAEANGVISLPLVGENDIQDGSMLQLRVSRVSLHEAAEVMVKQVEEVGTRLQYGSQNPKSDLNKNANLGSCDLELSSRVICSTVLKIGAQVAEAHPFVKFTWSVISFGFELVLAQADRDDKVVELVDKLKSLYEVIDTMKGLKAIPHITTILNRLLGQTVQCGYFLQNYSRSGFVGRGIQQTFSDVDAKISDLHLVFDELQKNLDTGLHIQTIRMLTDISEKLDISYLQAMLKPSSMEMQDRPTCLPETRQKVLEYIEKWIANPTFGRNVLWVYGLAGTGKSTVSATVAEMMLKYGLLGAFIFFNRSMEERNNPLMVIRTLAYKLAIYNPAIAIAISAAIKSIPGLVESPFDFQLQNLLITPLESVNWQQGHLVIVIDGLDECGTPETRKALLKALSDWFRKLSPLIQVLITSRHEEDIAKSFEKNSAIEPYELSIETKENQEDILTFIKHRMENICDSNDMPSGWPGNEQTKRLADMASGLFIWASTACLYIDSYNPEKQLRAIIALDSEVSSRTFSSLDLLYKTALQGAGPWLNRDFAMDCKSILGLIAVSKALLSCNAMDKILKLSMHSRFIVSKLGCLLHYEDKVQVLHPSLLDYLQNQERSGTEEWFINQQLHLESMASNCVELLSRELKYNFCEVELLPWDTPDPEKIDEAISHACRYWVAYVCDITAPGRELAQAVEAMLRKHLLHWIEAMSCLKSHNSTIRLLQQLAKWTKDHLPEFNVLQQLTYDGLRFSQHFFSTIEEHPLLVYHSALPFSPRATMIYELFNDVAWHFKVISPEWATWTSELLQLKGHHGPITSVSLSSDGTRIVTGSTDDTIRIWDANTGAEVFPPLIGHTDSVFCVAISPDGGRIASGSRDKTIRIWDANTGKETPPALIGHEGWVKSVSFSADGKKLVSGSADQTIRIWNLETRKIMHSPIRGHESDVQSVCFTPDNKRIVSGSDDKTVRIWDARTGKELLPPLRGHESLVQCISISPDGTKIASGATDRMIIIWDARTGEPLLPPLIGHEGLVNSVTFSIDGTRVVSASFDETIRVWDANTGKELFAPLRGHEHWILSVSCSPDGTRIVSGSFDETVRVWDTNSGTQESVILGHDNAVRCTQFSSDGTRIASGSIDNTLNLWSAETGELLFSLDGHESDVVSISFSSDGSKLVSGSSDMTMRLWDVATGEEILPPLMGHQDGILSVTFSSDGTKLASGSKDMTIRIWDANTGEQALQLIGHQNLVHSVTFSLDGTMLASGSSDRTVRIWDVITGKECIPALIGHENLVSSVAFSSDNTRVVSGSYDMTIRIWNALTGEQLLTPLIGHYHWILSVVFSPGDDWIISESLDHTSREKKPILVTIRMS
ncbi:hypothetical protein AMATHDRAFT_88311 [Amanita thiersii Skay4041]|uniref:C2 domain-containing protein n=1 Tax=Amanita thiersii Skay4041 TaxID=703135 RepID=A0A2A9N958_9AGAR|nr:hypothetical protein AMATHDRAFT_88311 [Amanita thiersii Skay4041]